MTCTETRPRILLADDHVAALAQAARVLGEQNEVVATVSNGLEALDAAARLDPDVVVLDISMPGLGGFDAARRFKQTGCRTKLIFLTVWEDPDFLREALELGADAYVVKSRLAADLLRAISQVMAGQRFVSPGLKT